MSDAGVFAAQRWVYCRDCAHADSRSDGLILCEIKAGLRNAAFPRNCVSFTTIAPAGIDRVSKDILFEDWLAGGDRINLKQVAP